MYNYKEEKHEAHKHCESPGCRQAGEFRAPKSRVEKPDYFWFCLDHVREYNKSWNYFEGMSPDEVERFQKEAPLGHRPTWNFQMQPGMSEKQLEARLRAWLNGSPLTEGIANFAPPIKPAHQKALDRMELAHPSDKKTIKTQYKKLVKQYHPDINQGDKLAEERFKSITTAYTLLMEEYVTG